MSEQRGFWLLLLWTSLSEVLSYHKPTSANMHPMMKSEVVNALASLTNSNGGSVRGNYLYSGGFGSLVKNALNAMFKGVTSNTDQVGQAYIWLYIFIGVVFLLMVATGWMYVKWSGVTVRLHRLESKVEVVTNTPTPVGS